MSDREIRESIRSGAETVEELASTCGAGACCGGCKPMLERLLHVERGCPRVRPSEPASRSAA